MSRANAAGPAPYPSVWRDVRAGTLLDTARFVPEGVRMARPPLWRNAGIVLAPYGLLLQHGNASTSLGWGDDSWRFGRWPTDDTLGPAGIAAVSRDAAAALRASWWPAMSARRSDRIPVDAWKADRPGDESVLSLLEALRLLLLHIPDASVLLAHRDAGPQLARALRAWPAKAPHPSGVRRGRMRWILDAMEHAGIEQHQHGRPYPGWDAPSLDELIGRVTIHLVRTGPTGRPISDDEVEAVVRSAYLNVEPWPFQALLRS